MICEDDGYGLIKGSFAGPLKNLIAQGEVQGREVEYWKVLEKIKIVRVKG